MKRKPIKWQFIFLIQIGILLTADALAIVLSLAAPHPAVYSLAMWALIPALGAGAAFWAAHSGVSCYAAWLMPVICHVATHWALSGYPPSSAGMPLVTAVASMVAAAAGEVARECARRGGE